MNGNGGSAGQLLIVPYGIETNSSEKCSAVKVLLIVPYGIETNSSEKCSAVKVFF